MPTNDITHAPLAVLLIEDNPGDARLIALMLQEALGAGVRIEHADRLANGLAHLAAARTPIDAILLDLSLPDSQGLATFARARAVAPDIPIVVLSGLADEELAARAVHDGAQDYLVKGQVDSPVLQRALRYAIERQRVEGERRRLLAREQAERVEAERLAAERAAILGQIADAVFTADTTGRVTFANAAAQRLCGRGADAMAEGWHEVTGATIRPDQQPLARAARGEAIRNGEWVIVRPDGTHVTVQGSAVPVRGADGDAHSAVLTLRDVTEERALEREREEFFANASHDLRTPLAAIKAAIGVVLANEPPGMPPPLHRLLGNIDRAATEMARLVDDLLELGRLQRGRAQLSLQPCDLRAIATHAARAIEPLAQARGQHLTVDLPPEPLPILGDAARLERTLLNLLGNSQKYGHDGGRIDLKLTTAPGEACIAVADDGPGIPPEDQARIFERFYRSHAESSLRVVGSGLGLPIVKTLVELHGGRVTLESTPGVGTTFHIALPLATGIRVADLADEGGKR